MEKKIYISGMHSGQNPCAGIGVARCLKKAFPQLTVVGVDHWQGCSGLHDAAVDEVLLLPQWKHIHDDRHALQIRSFLESGSIWFSSIDMEVHWLAKNLSPHPYLLAPGKEALELTAKPSVEAFHELGFRVAEYIPASISDADAHSFFRHASWRCWLKSPYHDAQRISNWGAFERARRAMSKTWNTSNLFLQRHVMGNEESLVFAAYQGELISAVHLQKRLTTPQGKTWAGRVTPVLPAVYEKIKKAVARLGWSGGGEIEYVVDPDGQSWVIECNPRFPAWIYGAALSGMNLPAQIISRAWKTPLKEVVSSFPFFTRVVQEIPAKEWVGLPLPLEPSSMPWSVDGKKGKGTTVEALPSLRDDKEDESDEEDPDETIETVPEPLFSEVRELSSQFRGETPARVLLSRWSEQKFADLASRVKTASKRTPVVRVGFSVKTSPTDEHLRFAKDNGFLAECISQKEVRRAVEFGFRSDQIILNGPGKFWPSTSPPVTGLHMLFCDSLEEFDRVIEIPNIAKVLGFRMRVPQLESRFGNALDEYKSFKRLVSAVKRLKGKAALGFHFHMPSWAIGIERWTEGLESLTAWCHALEQLSGVPVTRLDLGGGFFPPDLESLDLGSIQEKVAANLPNVKEIFFEPGRALTQEGEVLICRVLDVRRASKGTAVKDIVIDGCIAELPLAQAYAHRVFYRPASGEVTPLRKGKTRLLGRICMEDDILNNGLQIPESVDVGDYIILGDAGAYERSMSYVFGRG